MLEHIFYNFAFNELSLYLLFIIKQSKNYFELPEEFPQIFFFPVCSPTYSKAFESGLSQKLYLSHYLSDHCP